MLLRKSDPIGRFLLPVASLSAHTFWILSVLVSVLLAVPSLISLSDGGGSLEVVCEQAVSRAKLSAVS